MVNTCNPFILGHEWAHSVRAPHSLGYFVDTGTRFDDDWTASLMAGPPLSEYHTGDIEHMILADETWEAIKGEWE